MEKGLKIDLKIGAHSITPSILEHPNRPFHPHSSPPSISKLCKFYGISNGYYHEHLPKSLVWNIFISNPLASNIIKILFHLN